MKKFHEIDQSEVDVILEKKFPILSVQEENGSITSTVYITEEIGEVHDFIEIIVAIEAAEDDDTFIFKYGTPGGLFSTTVALLDAFNSTKATLLGEVIGEVASAGTMLLMGMDDIRVANHGSIMIHYYSTGMYGKASDLESRMNFESPHMKSAFYEIYTPFLTEDECTTVISGHEAYMNGEEIMLRWERVREHRQEVVKEQLKMHEESLISEGIEEATKFLQENAPELLNK